MDDRQPPSDHDEEARAFVADGLMVTGCGPVALASAPTTEVPLVIVDAAERPDLLDLRRVFVQEQPGGGEVHAQWDLLVYDAQRSEVAGDQPRGYVSLTIIMSQPVTSSLKLLFALPRWIDELEQIEVAPKLAIALGPPDAKGNWDPLRLIVLGNPGSHAHDVIRNAVDLVESWDSEPADST
jgi:hypothetical protein